jgi:hypothetical protein
LVESFGGNEPGRHHGTVILPHVSR